MVEPIARGQRNILFIASATHRHQSISCMKVLNKQWIMGDSCIFMQSNMIDELLSKENHYIFNHKDFLLV